MEGFVFVSGGVVGAKWKGMEVCGRCPVGMGRRAVVVSHSSSSSASPSKETLEEIDPGEVEVGGCLGDLRAEELGCFSERESGWV